MMFIFWKLVKIESLDMDVTLPADTVSIKTTATRITGLVPQDVNLVTAGIFAKHVKKYIYISILSDVTFRHFLKLSLWLWLTDHSH